MNKKVIAYPESKVISLSDQEVIIALRKFISSGREYFTSLEAFKKFPELFSAFVSDISKKINNPHLLKLLYRLADIFNYIVEKNIVSSKDVSEIISVVNSITTIFNEESKQNLMIRDLCSAAIWCSIIGDSLGMPYEGMTSDKIRRLITPESLDYQPNRRRKKESGTYTDDSGQLLAVVDTFNTFGYLDTLSVKKALHEWFEKTDRQDMGKDTFQALSTGVPNEMSTGNGALMRALPVILISLICSHRLVTNKNNLHSITHPNWLYHDTISLYEQTIDYLMHNDSLEGFFDSLSTNNEELIDSLERLSGLLGPKGLDEEIEDMKNIGIESHVAQTFFSALYAFLRYPRDFKKAMYLAIAAGGDTDTRALITGSFLGIYNGLQIIPPGLFFGLQESENIGTQITTFTSLLLH